MVGAWGMGVCPAPAPRKRKEEISNPSPPNSLLDSPTYHPGPPNNPRSLTVGKLPCVSVKLTHILLLYEVWGNTYTTNLMKLLQSKTRICINKEDLRKHSVYKVKIRFHLLKSKTLPENLQWLVVKNQHPCIMFSLLLKQKGVKALADQLCLYYFSMLFFCAGSKLLNTGEKKKH